MNFHILTLFPDMVMQGLGTSIIGRAVNNGLLSMRRSISGITRLTNIKAWMIIHMEAEQVC